MASFSARQRLQHFSGAFECSHFAYNWPGYVWFDFSVLAVPHNFGEFCNVHLSLVFE